MGGWHGQDIGNPVAEMREYVALVRALLAGGEPPAGRRWNSSFAFNGFKARADIPVYLAGLSPAMLRLAGEIADGVVLWACPASYVEDVVIREVAAGRARANKVSPVSTSAPPSRALSSPMPPSPTAAYERSCTATSACLSTGPCSPRRATKPTSRPTTRRPT